MNNDLCFSMPIFAEKLAILGKVIGALTHVRLDKKRTANNVGACEAAVSLTPQQCRIKLLGGPVPNADGGPLSSVTP